LLDGGDRHVTAETLHNEAATRGMRVSLATVYNTLHQFTRAGLLRQVTVDASRTYFDTNTSNHQHFLFEETGELRDIPPDTVRLTKMPAAPEGAEIRRVDIVIRVGPARI
jgi:Fur family iron response transcriptional regulator